MAAQIGAAERLRAEGVDGIGLLFVVDEEMGSVGARAANAHPLAGECRWLIDGEPTDNRLATGCKGSLRLTLCTAGLPAHSAYPEHGRSAIDALLDVLMDVRHATWPTDPMFGETTVNIGVIAGGARPNVVAADARADLQIRLVTEAAPVQALLERAVRDRARIDYLTAVPPLRLATVPGFETCVVRFTTDIPHLTNWGTPLLLGPGSILDAHSAHERISEAELAEGADAHVRLVHALAGRNVVEERGGALVYGANFSIGVNLFYRIVAGAAELLRGVAGYDPFIEEAHHARKRDAPSGTAVALQAILSRGLGPGQEGRRVPIASTRAGHIPGTHRVGFDSAADQILLVHTARSRAGCAAGALLAARWIVGRRGVYAFADVLDDKIGRAHV